MPLDLQKVKTEITNLQTFWSTTRNNKFKEWYEFLIMIDQLAAKGMESYVSNEPGTFYKMAHYLLTKGEISHYIPVEVESSVDLDNRAKVHRACQYMWTTIDRERKLGGDQSFISDLSFYMLVLGWYSVVLRFDATTGLLQSQIWNPYDVYPKFTNNKMTELVHSYKITKDEAVQKASENNWSYTPKVGYTSSMTTADIVLNDFFILDKGIWQNAILIDGEDVMGGFISRPEMSILTAPVGGFPDKGSLTPKGKDWRSLTGKGIFELNETVATSFNKWKSMVAQILRDTAQPITQEFATTPQATPEQLRERGGLFHYAPGEAGLQRLPPAAIPIEIQANMLELRREMQKGSFNDAVYGMMEGQSGYSLSLLASSSANQILYPYMEAKHFVIGESDKFWLSNLKTSKRVFDIKGKFIEKLKPTDIPDDVAVIVESDVATPKDWLERGTIGGMVREDLDKATLLAEIYKLPDPQGIIRRKSLDRVLDNPMTQQIELIAGYQAHADYLERRGDVKQAQIFRKAAVAIEAQLGAPAPGQGKPNEMTEIQSERTAGSPKEQATVPSRVSPPETKGFTPMQLRRSIGRGSVRVT
jgi:hypothetical protein